MARPVKIIKRTEKLTLYYTKTEMKFIHKMAGKYNISRAQFARLKSLDHKIVPRLSAQEIDLYRKLAGMANNLNQLAHAANTGRIFTQQILNTLEAINYTVDKLR